MSDLLELPWTEALREVAPAEYLVACVRAIRDRDPELQAFLHVDDAVARGQIEAGARIPLAVKDNIVTREMPTTCASRILEGFRSPVDATAVMRARHAGYALIGKTNLDEFAMGSSTEHSAFGPTKNPWNPRLVPGGSSGGSAAAVAARMVPAALGSETGGSVRQPAALCGIVGVKPTWGRVSRSGLVAFASSLDQVGVMTKTVAESAHLLGAIAGCDALDATSSAADVDDYVGGLGHGVRGLRVGVVRECVALLDGDARRNFDEAVHVMASIGAEIVEVSVPAIGSAVAIYTVLANAEASANLARFDGVHYGRRGADAATPAGVTFGSRSEGFGAEVKRRIMLGTFALSSGYYDAYYRRAQLVRARLRRDFDDAFRKVDCLVTPTVPAPAFPLGSRLERPLEMYLSDIFTAPANLAGIPAIAVPSGFTPDDLPLSLQVMTPHFQERLMFRVAAAFEKETEHWKRSPLTARR